MSEGREPTSRNPPTAGRVALLSLVSAHSNIHIDFRRGHERKWIFKLDSTGDMLTDFNAWIGYRQNVLALLLHTVSHTGDVAKVSREMHVKSNAF